MADAAGHGRGDHSAHRDQLRARPRAGAVRGAGADLPDPTAVPAGAGLRLGDPGHAAAGAAVHRLLRAAAVRRRHRPVPGRRDRVQPERGRLRGRGDPRGDPEHPEGPVGGRADHRLELPGDAAADHPAAGRAHGRAAAVEHADLAGQGHLAGLDDPGHRAAAGGPARGRADVRLLRALRRRGPVLLGDLRDPLVLPGQAGDATGKVRRSDDRSAHRPRRPQGVRRPRRAAGHLVRRAGRHGHGGHRAVGLGQDDRPAHAQRARPGRRGGHHDRRRVGRLRRRPGPSRPDALPRPERHGLPEPQPVPAQDGAAERHRGPGRRAEAAEGRRLATRRCACWRRSASRRRRTSTPTSSPAASSSASASPARWRCAPS